jgi:hypothetical protein
MWFLLQRDGHVPSYSRSLAVRGEVGARSGKRVRRAREKMTAARDLGLCHVISPSFQWVGLGCSCEWQNRQGAHALRAVDDKGADNCAQRTCPKADALARCIL